jgi:hypothetical protein
VRPILGAVPDECGGKEGNLHTYRRKVFLISAILALWVAFSAEGARTGVVDVTIRPRVETVGTGRRVILDIVFSNNSPVEEVKLPTNPILASCRASRASLYVLDRDGVALKSRGMISEGGGTEVLRPRTTLTIQNIDITDSYVFPAEQQTLRLLFKGTVVDVGEPFTLTSAEVPLPYIPVTPGTPTLMSGVLDRREEKGNIVIACRKAGEAVKPKAGGCSATW